MEDFLRLAHANTQKNLETCGVLAGSLVSKTKISRRIHACFMRMSHWPWFLKVLPSCGSEKQGLPPHYSYNPKARVNLRFGMMTTFS